MTTSLGTAAAAAMNIFALTVNPVPTMAQPVEQQVRLAHRIPSRSLIAQNVTQLTTVVANDERYEESARPTTPHEIIIGEIRQWNLLNSDWDGEGAATPNSQSIKEAVSFVRLLDDNITLPEPMLLGSGHAALYWNEGSLYADIEFLGDGRIAYFIKCNGDKHKGVLSFDSQEMPALFPTLIKA